MFTRRTFLRFTGASTLTLFVLSTETSALGRRRSWARPIRSRRVTALDPAAIPKFETPLLIPPAMPMADAGHDDHVDRYRISVRQFAQQVLPAPTPSRSARGPSP